MPLAAPLILPFAELAGITIAGLGMAAASQKVSDFISANPEASMEILNMIVPGSKGLETLFKKKAKEDSDDESVEVAPEDRTKEERAKEIKKRFKEGKGDKREIGKKAYEEVIKPVKDIEDLLEGEKRYDGSLEDAPKPKFDFTKFFRNRKADGGAIGIEVLFEEKKDGGRIGFANGGENIIGADLKDERPFYQQVVEDRIIDLIPADIATAHGKAMYTPQGIANTSNSIRDYHIAANADLSNRLSNKIGENYGNIAQTAYNIAAPALSIPASLGYDFSQAQSRMEPGSGIKGLAKAFMDEAPFSAAYQRAIGAAAPLAEQSSNVLNKISDFFFAPAGAADFQGGEMLQTPGVMVDANEGFRTAPRTNVQGMDLEMDPGARINPDIQPQQNIFQRAGNVFSSIKDNIPNFGIMGLLSNLDRFDTLSPEDQSFILNQAGGNRPSKDRYGINRRSALGNYAQYVRDKGIFAPGKRGEYYRSLNIPGLDTAMKETVAREQRAKRAYEKQIRDAADAAARDAARARSITAGYGGSDDSRGATGPTAGGAGMGVGGGYASDYGFAKGGLATMFVEKR
jgi:hypothetical protein